MKTKISKAVYAIAAFIGFAMPVSAADVSWTLSGGTAEDPLVIPENVELTSSDKLYFKNESLAYVTSGQETALCSALYCTESSKNSPVVFVGNLLYAGSFTGSYGSITKYGDWESTGSGSFLLGHGGGTFAFTNETGNITVPAVGGKSDSGVTGRLQLGYGNNATAIYCHNGGTAVFNQLVTGFANGAPASHAKNSKNHLSINGGNLTITGRANFGCGVNTTWYDQTGGDMSIGEMLYVGKLANSTNYWTISDGTVDVASTAYIGFATNSVTEWRQTGGYTTFSNVTYVGYGVGSTNSWTISGGTATFGSGDNIYIAYGTGSTNNWTISGGTVELNGLAYVGYGANSSVEWRQSGGITTCAKSLQIGYSPNDSALNVAMYHSGGILVVSNYLNVGYSNSDASDTYFEISGGVVSNVTAQYSTSIAAEGQLGSRSELKVKGNGKLYVNYLFNVGLGGAGILTIEDDGFVEMPNKTLNLSNGNSANSSPNVGEDCYVNLNGGTLLTQGVKHGNGRSDAYLIFDGGTLKAAATPNTTNGFLPATDLNVLVGDNGGTIDTSLASVTINSSISNKVGCAGGMTFKGGNSATVTGRLSYAGATTVELGTTLTVADRADVFDTGAGLVCLVSDPSAAETQQTVLTTSGDDEFTSTDLAKCSATGSARVKFVLSPDAKSIVCQPRKGLIVSFR